MDRSTDNRFFHDHDERDPPYHSTEGGPCTPIRNKFRGKRISDWGEQAAALTAADERGRAPRALERAYRWYDHGNHPHHVMADMKPLPARAIERNIPSAPADSSRG